MMTTLDLIPGAEPIYLPGSKTGCLLIHGFTASPHELRGLAEHLHAAEFTVLAPRLTHHGTDPADMNRSRWMDWYFAALDGWYILRQVCDEIIVCGLSMGGLTALLIAAQQPVAGLVVMSVPLTLYPDWRLRWARQIGMVRPYIPKGPQNPQIDEERIVYDVTPTLAIAEIQKFQEFVRKALPAVHAPALLIHDRGDETAPPDSLTQIQQRINAYPIETLWLESGVHVVTQGPDKELVFARVAAFISAISNQRSDK